jgi:hypothetical protein
VPFWRYSATRSRSVASPPTTGKITSRTVSSGVPSDASAIFRSSLNYWYLARKGNYTAVLKVRGTVVQELGIADNVLTKTRKARDVLMHSFY